MNVASPELCKELYELSSWETGIWLTPNGNVVDHDGGFTSDRDFPAYDLGYLLRKLPEEFELYYDEESYQITCAACHGWSTNPEDAVIDVIIQLFEQCVLSKGGDD